MPEFNLVGPTYVAAAGNSDCQRTVNLYPEVVESGMGKGKVSLESAPGLAVAKEFATQTVSGGTRSRINALFVDQERMWVIACGQIWEWSGTAATLKQPLVSSTGYIPDADAFSIASNGKELLICASDFGTVSRGVWLYTIATNTIVALDATGYPDAWKGTQCAFLDGYFVLFSPVDPANSQWSQKFYISALYDGTTWDSLDFSSAEGNPDRIMAIITDHRELWCFGRQTTEVFVNTGASPFPIERINGATLDFGCIAYRSVQKLDNSLFFVGGDQRGPGIVYRTKGYSVERVSNHAVEAALNASGVDLEACYAYTYTEAGHTFYCLTISATRATFVYDAVSGMWHERGAWNPGAGDFIAYQFSSHCFFKNVHYVCGPTTDAIAPAGVTNLFGLMYEQSLALLSLEGDDIRRMRVTPHLSAEQAWQFYHSVQIDLEVSAYSDITPVVSLDWSDDGGKSWSNVHALTLASTWTAGAQKFRAIWRRLGRGRDRVFRFYVEAQCRWSFINGYLKHTAGTGI